MTVWAIIAAGSAHPCQPWPRRLLAPAAWAEMAAALTTEPVDLLALWADGTHAHALLQQGEAFMPVSVPVVDGAYPALSPSRPAAAWFERMVRDLWGHTAAGGRDARPWLDHGAWPGAAPLAPRPPPPAKPAEPMEFLATEGDGLTQSPCGPLPSGVGEAGEFRFTVMGERVARMEARLGYSHKGTLGLMRGKSPRAAARFAARIAGDATVAHSIAFARAAEAAGNVAAPPRALTLRAVMAELERIAVHAGDIAAMAEADGAASRWMWHREALLRAASTAFGHRLMMDCVTPGGVAADIATGGAEAIATAIGDLEEALPALLRSFESLALAGCGIVAPAQAEEFAAGGVVGRASGRAADLRRVPGYAPYENCDVPVPRGGDAAARLQIRAVEIGHSIALLRRMLPALPDGPLAVGLPQMTGEGIGWAEGPRGDIWHWLRLDGGQITAAFARDPGWLHWPLLELAASGPLADVPLTSASFGCSASGVDL